MTDKERPPQDDPSPPPDIAPQEALYQFPTEAEAVQQTREQFIARMAGKLSRKE